MLLNGILTKGDTEISLPSNVQRKRYPRTPGLVFEETISLLWKYYRLQTTLQSKRPTVNEPRELRLGHPSLPPSPYHSQQAFS